MGFIQQHFLYCNLGSLTVHRLVDRNKLSVLLRPGKPVWIFTTTGMSGQTPLDTERQNYLVSLPMWKFHSNGPLELDFTPAGGYARLQPLPSSIPQVPSNSLQYGNYQYKKPESNLKHAETSGERDL